MKSNVLFELKANEAGKPQFSEQVLEQPIVVLKGKTRCVIINGELYTAGTLRMVREGHRLGITNANEMPYLKLFNANRVADPFYYQTWTRQQRIAKLESYGCKLGNVLF